MDATRARELLEQRRADLEIVARAATKQGSLDQPQSESSGEVTSMDQHTADVATDTLEREMGLSVREAARGSLREVERALARVDAGTYGTCPTCGNAIPDERLEAMPEAEFCVDDTPAVIEEPRTA